MAEASSPRRSATPSTVPQKRPLSLDDEQHVPAVSSPLNPDFASSRARRPTAPREQREKKESLKKREAKSTDNTRVGTPDNQGHGRKTKKGNEIPNVLSPPKYKLPAPKPSDFEPPTPPIFTPILTRGGRQFYESSEHVYNRKGFRYTYCIADPTFPSSQRYRQSETEPFGPRINFEDSSSHVFFDRTGKSITTPKGFRMARANVGVREGRWYWECKILSGVKSTNHENGDAGNLDSGGHVRLGWARREASLDTPVGFDAYSYGLRDVAGQKVHMSRPKDFMPAGEEIRTGDVIGLEINLPSLNLHRKVVEGSYNKAVDVSDDVEPSNSEAPDIIRDRLPIRHKAHLYFEQYEYHSTKELEELMNPSPVITANGPVTTKPPDPNHAMVSLRTLPFSSIQIYKNGRLIGTPFTNLLAFLPPASKPPGSMGTRDGVDDGTLGYYPAVSVFRGGAAEANFGPDFWYPPAELLPADTEMSGTDSAHQPSNNSSTSQKKLIPLSERYNEQIAEDIVYDIIDEVDFWMQDGGSREAETGVPSDVPRAFGPADSAAPSVGAVAVDLGGIGGNGQTEEIREVVQEEE